VALNGQTRTAKKKSTFWPILFVLLEKSMGILQDNAAKKRCYVTCKISD